MIDANQLFATEAIANVEAYLAQQYDRRKVTEKPADGVVGMWIRIVRIAIKKVGEQWRKVSR